MAKERITIEKLATMVAGGFNELRTEMRKGFRSVNDRLDAHDQRFDTIEGQLAQHTATLRDHSNRLDRIETKLDNTIARVDDHSVRIEHLEKTREP